MIRRSRSGLEIIINKEIGNSLLVDTEEIEARVKDHKVDTSIEETIINKEIGNNLLVGTEEIEARVKDHKVEEVTKTGIVALTWDQTNKVMLLLDLEQSKKNKSNFDAEIE